MSPHADGLGSSDATMECSVLVVAQDVPSCRRCDGPPLLVARIPRPIERTDDGLVAGTRSVVLCPACDRDDPDAQGVLAFLAVHESIGGALEPAASLIREWAERTLHRALADGDDRPKPC